jgi:hypothetical protein
MNTDNPKSYIWKIPAHPGPLQNNPIFSPGKYRVISASADPRAIRDFTGFFSFILDRPDARLVPVEDAERYCAGKTVFYNLSVSEYCDRVDWGTGPRNMVMGLLRAQARSDLGFAYGECPPSDYNWGTPPRNPILSDEQQALVWAAYNAA